MISCAQRAAASLTVGQAAWAGGVGLQAAGVWARRCEPGRAAGGMVHVSGHSSSGDDAAGETSRLEIDPPKRAQTGSQRSSKGVGAGGGCGRLGGAAVASRWSGRAGRRFGPPPPLRLRPGLACVARRQGAMPRRGIQEPLTGLAWIAVGLGGKPPVQAVWGLIAQLEAERKFGTSLANSPRRLKFLEESRTYNRVGPRAINLLIAFGPPRSLRYGLRYVPRQACARPADGRIRQRRLGEGRRIDCR